MRRIILPMLLLALACDRAPMDPSIVVPDAASTQNTLPALFREAIDRTRAVSGQPGVDALLAEYNAKQKLLNKRAATASREMIQGQLDAIHREQLRVIMNGLGNEAVTRVLSQTKLSLAQSEVLMASAKMAGIEARGNNIVAQVREKVKLADSYASSGKSIEALDVATQAATILTGLDYYLVEIRRIGGVEALYPRAVSKILSSDDVASRSLLQSTEAATDAARNALRDGAGDGTQAKLEAARRAQIDLVVKTLGPSAAIDLVSEVGTRADSLRESLANLRTNGSDVLRAERMLREAVDLNKRAAAAVAKRDYASAIDLGSHAAGMLNAVGHITH